MNAMIGEGKTLEQFNAWYDRCKARNEPFLYLELRGRGFAAATVDLYSCDRDMTTATSKRALELGHEAAREYFARGAKEPVYLGGGKTTAGSVSRLYVDIARRLLGDIADLLADERATEPIR
jgi:hypothetical protein